MSPDLPDLKGTDSSNDYPLELNVDAADDFKLEPSEPKAEVDLERAKVEETLGTDDVTYNTGANISESPVIEVNPEEKSE